MEKIVYGAKNRLYLFLLVVSQILIGIIIAVSALFWVNSVSDHTEEILKEEAVNMVKDELKNHVEHVILHIERENRMVLDNMKNMANLVFSLLVSKENGQINTQIENRMRMMPETKYAKALTIVLHDLQTNRMQRFSKKRVDDISAQFNAHTLSEYVHACPIYKELVSGNKKVYIFVESKVINRLVKERVYKDIHAYLHGDEGYIWVNEVINFNGGDRYAVRVIHPNMVDTEGQYLSTNIKDIAGNLPYQAELQGIRESGEVFHTYYFKNKTNDKISEKASYSKLYKPFNWIVSSGRPLEDVMVYANELSTYNERKLEETLWNAFLCICAVLIIDIAVIVAVNKIHHREVVTYIDQETKLDPLTGVLSRKAAEGLLTKGVEDVKHNKSISMLMILDIDDFKKINDTYGHDVGDLVLKKISERILNSLRKTDHLFRWGGEEFVIFFNNLPLNRHYSVGKHLLESVSAITFESNGTAFNITISIGSSYIHDTDSCYTDTLKRADVALYHSKNTGKNKYTYAEDLA